MPLIVEMYLYHMFLTYRVVPMLGEGVMLKIDTPKPVSCAK